MPNATLNATLNSTLQAIVGNSAPIQISVTPMPTPIPASMATNVLDWQPVPVFGIPLWAIFAMLSIGALIVVILHWNDMSADLNAIKPWYIKIKEIAVGKMQVLRLSRAGTFIPDCLDIFDNVLSYGDSEENINQWHLNSPQGAIRIGGISAAIISEDWDQNRDIVAEIAICTAADTLNSNIENLRVKLNERYQELVLTGAYPSNAINPSNLVRPMENGMDYIGKTDPNKPVNRETSIRALLQLLYPDGIRIPAHNLFDQNKVRKFWFKGNTSAFYGGDNLRRVEDELIKHSEKQTGFLEKWGSMLIAALVFFGCLIAGIMIPLG